MIQKWRFCCVLMWSTKHLNLFLVYDVLRPKVAVLQR